jgi:hypothetical protein
VSRNMYCSKRWCQLQFQIGKSLFF